MANDNDEVLVTTNPNPLLYIDVDLSSDKWSSLHPHKLPAFHMEELKRPCSVYKDGIFPGARDVQNNTQQSSRIVRFPNYIEFCKVVSDEVVPIEGQLYLTSKFYDRRKEGWSSDTIRKKSGKVLGYCINGFIYNVHDQKEVVKVFYGIIYKSLVNKIPEFNQLLECIQTGACLILKGANKEFHNHLAEILLDTVNGNSEM